MHISIFAYGTWGDIRPHVALGMALQNAGHTVQVVASPGYEAWVRARHLGFYPLTTDVNTFAKENASIMDAGIVQQLQTFGTYIKPILVQMGLEAMEATRESDVLLTIEFGIALLIDVVQVNKLKTILINPAPLNPTRAFPSPALPPAPGWFPFSPGYNRLTHAMLQRIVWSTVAGARHEIASHLGLPKRKFGDYRAMLAAAPALTTVSKHVVPRPADWDAHFQVTGYLFDDDPDWTPPPDLIDFLAAGEAPVYIGFGSMPDSKPQVTTQLLFDAVQQTGKRAVILTGWAGFGAQDVPSDIYLLKYAPHTWLFPKMAAVVHHGGAGTTAAGFRAGVPTVIVPHNGDQPYWGRVAKHMGIGTTPIPRKKLSADQLAAAIVEATSDRQMRDKAAELSRKIAAEDGVSEAVRVIGDFLA
jgi:UDP:flavonoid glycosyltransferase YjiC (YdhE family)